MRSLIVLPFLIASGLATAAPCKHQAPRNLDIDPAGLRTLVLELGSSDAKVRGEAGLQRIEVRGKACASDESQLEKLQLLQGREGDRVTVAVDKRDIAKGSWFGSDYAYLDIEVRMPAQLAMDVVSGSGDTDISDIAALSVKTGSGDVVVRNIAGDVTMRVSSGDVDARDVGAFHLTSTGSGDVRAIGVRGDVRADQGGSGDLDFEDVKGNVVIGNVGSGAVSLRSIDGTAEVGSIGSGDVTASGIGGDLIVRAQGSGDTRHSGVNGRVELPGKKRRDS
jgi:DUF4097 and DUF4098 domain-containing protein YvlB